MKRMALTLLLLAACDSPGEPVESPSRVVGQRAATELQIAFGTSAYAHVADCLGLRNQSQLVRWWIADAITIYGQPKSGMMNGHDIWIRSDYADWQATYRHESMHHILWTGRGNSDVSHSSPEWVRCAECPPGVDCSDIT